MVDKKYWCLFLFLSKYRVAFWNSIDILEPQMVVRGCVFSGFQFPV